MERQIAVIILTVIFSAVLSTGAPAAEKDSYAVFTRGLDMEHQLLIFEARDDLKKTIEMEPGNAGYLSYYAWFLTSYGFIEEAADTFQKLLYLSDDKRSVHLGLGFTNQQLGRLKDSLSAYKNCLSISSPDMKTAFEEIRLGLSRENEVKINSLLDQIASQTNPVENQRTLVKAYIDEGKLSNAIEAAESLRIQGQLDLLTHLWLARAYFWLGEKVRSNTEYNALIKQSPQSAFLYIDLAELLESEERLQEAQTALERALVLYPDAVSARKKLAELYARTGDYEKAKSLADSIEDKGANRLSAMMARARTSHFSGLLEEARSIYAMVLKEYPDNADALWGMTETSIYSGKYTDALRTIQQWEDTVPDSRLEPQKQLVRSYIAPHAKVKMEFYDNSSNFSRKNAGAEYSFYADNDLRVESGYHFSEFSQKDFDDVNRHSLFLSAEKDFSPLVQIGGRLAGNFYDNDNRSLNVKFDATLQATPELSVRPYFRHFDIIDTIQPFENAIYNYVVTIGSVGMGITSNEFGMTLNYRPVPLLSFAGDYQYGDYSDGNKKQGLTIGAEYRLATQPDFRFAYYYFYLDYKNPAPVYWEGGQAQSAYFDPVNFGNHSLWIIYRHDNGERIFYGGEASLSYLPKSHGIGTLLSPFVGWRVKESLDLRLDVRWYYINKGLDRYGVTESFMADNILLVFDYRF